jgi:hypothetical protein
MPTPGHQSANSQFTPVSNLESFKRSGDNGRPVI